MMKFTDVPMIVWKIISLAFMWLIIGVACVFSPEQAKHMVDSGCFTTFLVWIFG